jgi:hypothetical protein
VCGRGRGKQSYLDWLIGASLKNKAVTEGKTIKRQRCSNKGKEVKAYCSVD